ncbi:DUF4412 domain-containing protein [Chromatium okenii]|uniref:DUF4412 domain-containing protein n=1 Tax=Chromatium okenii TaxID=61644 RepID=A0A2S7XPA8_9GAMM|nr:DUF4412 domain-containing protein [Chromatium okenii]PQJ95574.1 hypothetical protein CXB77_15765 [Chromatium okenii]
MAIHVPTFVNSSVLLRGLRLTVAALLTMMVSLPVAFADDTGFYFETINRGTGMTGEAPQDELSKTYLANGKMKVTSSDPQGTDMIVDPASGNMTFLNHAAKQYYQINIQRVKESMSQPGMEQMRAMVANTKITVTDTGETKKIGDWDCKKYLVSKTGMMNIEQEVWATEAVDVDVSRFTDMMSLSGADGLLAGSAEGKAQQEEMAKIKGYPILTKTKMQMMGTEMETESEVKVIRKEVILAATFDIPADYTEKQMEPESSADSETPDVIEPDAVEMGSEPTSGSEVMKDQ